MARQSPIQSKRSIRFWTFVILAQTIFSLALHAEVTNNLATAADETKYYKALESLLGRTKNLLATKSQPTGPVRLSSRRNPLGNLNQFYHPTMFKDVNESLRLTVEAGEFYLKRENLKQAKELLKEAKKKYSENALASLLLADIFLAEGSRGEAIHYYLGFWNQMESARPKSLVSLIFKRREKSIAMDHVEKELRFLGLEAPKGKTMDLFSFFSKAGDRELTLPRIFVTYALPILLFLGIPFFIYRRITGDDVPSPEDRILYGLYLVIFCSYLVWLGHQSFNLPSLFQPAEWEVLAILGIGIAGVFATEVLLRFWQRERERRDPDTIFCPHCGKSILKLALVCPLCNRKIEREVKQLSGR